MREKRLTGYHGGDWVILRRDCRDIRYPGRVFGRGLVGQLRRMLRVQDDHEVWEMIVSIPAMGFPSLTDDDEYPNDEKLSVVVPHTVIDLVEPPIPAKPPK